ncbi:MAG: hypothetical protein WC516_06405 [Patescibacteria group bacterium]|jgi:hypothetical protein
MAVIKKENRYYEKGTTKQYLQIVKCDSKGVFSCNVPDEWRTADECEILNTRTYEKGLSANSIDSLTKKYNDLWQKYNDKEEVTELVIVFEFAFEANVKVNKMQTKIVENNADGVWLDYNEEKNRRSDNSLGFDIQAATFRKTKTIFRSNGVIMYKYDKVYNDRTDVDKGKQLKDYMKVGIDISDWSTDEQADEIPYSDEMRDCLNALGEKVVFLIIQLKKIFTDGKIKNISGSGLAKLLEGIK